jgi:hypothetical protein
MAPHRPASLRLVGPRFCLVASHLFLSFRHLRAHTPSLSVGTDSHAEAWREEPSEDAARAGEGAGLEGILGEIRVDAG